MTRRERRFEKRGIDISTYSSSSDNKIDLGYFKRVVVERNHQKRVAPSSKTSYHGIFDNFLDFLDLFNTLPDRWEDKIVLYVSFLADNIYEEQTIKSYLSAIRHELKQDGVRLDEDKFLLESIIRSSRFKNREKRERLGISEQMLHRILDQVDLTFDQQPYLKSLYKAMYVLGFYCLLRVSELTSGAHPILAKNVIAARNKLKKQVTLVTSKSHTIRGKKQVIRFPDPDEEDDAFKWLNTKYCPFTILDDYIRKREEMASNQEQFFIFRSNLPVKEGNFRRILKRMIQQAGYDVRQYNTHSFWIGRANHLLYKLNFNIDRIKLKGRWSSDSIWKYFR